MKTIRKILFPLALFFLVYSAGAQSEIKKFPATGGLTFEFRDELNSAIYNWPATLLTYYVDFSAAKVRAETLALTDASKTGAPQPCVFQLSEKTTASDGTLVTAKVSFISDLPPGAARKFVLGAAAQGQEASVNADAGANMPVVSKNVGDFIEISNGLLQVRVPATRASITPTAPLPAPICAIADAGAWIGSADAGGVISPNKKPLSLKTEILDSGPLFVTCRMTYTFEKDARYITTVRLVAGYRHVEFSERMENFDPADGARVEMAWKNFAPTTRFAARDWETPEGAPGRGIDDPVRTDGIIEEPHWFPANQHEDPSKDMIYRLAAFQGNGPRDAVPVMSFWEGDERGNPRANGRELSVFVPHTDGWDDGQYGIWQPGTTLTVHFRHENKTLIWTWPLASGCRATGITFHDVAWGVQQVEKSRAIYRAEAKDYKDAFRDGWCPRIDEFRARYAQLLRSWHGMLDLDRVKDWTLTYSENAKRPPAHPPGAGNPKATPQSLESAMFHSPLMLYPLGANLAVINISHRMIRGFVDDYLLTRDAMTPAQRRHIDALLLFSAYANADDDFASMRVCVTGTPNMSSDGFCVPAEIVSLYPDHPMGREWREQLQKIIEIQGVFYTRPDVPAWNALGGRWTESLTVYNWAYLLPTETAQCVSTPIDGQNRIATPEFAQRGRWMVDELSAPIYNPDPANRLKRIIAGEMPKLLPPGWKPADGFTQKAGFERQYSPHGAHSTGSGVIPPDHVAVLGRYLMRYDPLTAEHLLWAQAQIASHDKGEWTKRIPLFVRELEQLGGNTGTPPHFASSKYTGHGIILRAGVGTTEELSIHLDQIDQGPNYRWGNNGEGSSGVLYFYAGGQVWSGHERENTGDHTTDDTTGNTNFGVLKDHAFRTIGANVLDQPLYDLGVAQFATIAARAENAPYSWPQYKSRSVQLVGTDYFLLIDDAVGCARFSWFTMKDLPFPKLVFLEPMKTRDDHWSEVTTPMSQGIYRDIVRESTGSVVLVTHKKNSVEMAGLEARPLLFLERAHIDEYRPAKGAPQARGVYRVRTPGGADTVFCSVTQTQPIKHRAIDSEKRPEFFEGTNGVIRRRADGSTQLALLRGTRIGASGVGIETRAQDELGVSAIFAKPTEITGVFTAPRDGARMRIGLPKGVAGKFYIDGAPAGLELKDGSSEGVAADLWLALPQGRHNWQFTAGDPTPCASQVVRTENYSGGAKVLFIKSAGATTYRIETSADGCATWTKAIETAASPCNLTGLDNGKKIHIRVIAANATRTAEPGDAYPLYVSDKPQLSPDGLMLTLSKDKVALAWGEVLGAGEYRVYRRLKNATDSTAQWQKIYSGSGRTYVDDMARGVVPPAQYPGTAANLGFAPPAASIYEYAVACANGNGEGEKCEPVSTDPTNWCNWWPAGQERKFKRATSYWQPPYVEAEATPSMRYP